MMTKHTLGDWEAIGDNIYAADTRVGNACGRTDEEAEANALVMGARPALPAACRSAAAWLEHCDMTDTAQYRRLVAAIGKSVRQ